MTLKEEPPKVPVGFRKPSDVLGSEAVKQLRQAGWHIVRNTTEATRRFERDSARQQAYWAQIEASDAREWGRSNAQEADRLRERCTYLYEKALEHGATHDELRQP